MAFIATTLVFAFALWLLAVSIMMMARPHLMLKALAKMGSTPLINYTELMARFIIGLAVYHWAEVLGLHVFVKWAGLFLSVTAVLLMVIPRRWHHAYAVWWSDRLSPRAVQWVSPLSFFMGLIILKALF